MSAALGELSRLSGMMGLSKAVQEEAAVIYRKALEADLIRGRSIDAMVAVCTWLIKSYALLVASMTSRRLVV